MSQTRATGGAFRVGTALGIPIRIHFTFFLLLLWFGMASASTGEGFLTGVVFILLLFGCVVLHELGRMPRHATQGRRDHRHRGHQQRESSLLCRGRARRRRRR